jgi:hypothetical protein
MKHRLVIAFVASAAMTNAPLFAPAAWGQTAPPQAGATRTVPAPIAPVQAPPAPIALTPMPPGSIASRASALLPTGAAIIGAAAGATIAAWLWPAAVPAGGAVLAPAAGAWAWNAYLSTEAAAGAVIGAVLGYFGGRGLPAKNEAH